MNDYRTSLVSVISDPILFVSKIWQLALGVYAQMTTVILLEGVVPVAQKKMFVRKMLKMETPEALDLNHVDSQRQVFSKSKPTQQ